MPKGILFLQDNAPAHNSHVAMQTIRDFGFKLLEHPISSPGLALFNYHVIDESLTDR